MASVKSVWDPRSYAAYILDTLEERRIQRHSNLRGATYFPPGHFASPLMDIEALGADAKSVPFDGPECWEHIDLRADEQRAYYKRILDTFHAPPFSALKTSGSRYYTQNEYFVYADAFTLWGIIQCEKPRRIVEVGSGFSSAVVLDTLAQTRSQAALTFIEPFPVRLRALLSSADQSSVTILDRPVQGIPLSTFDQLQAQDILFIDSSHVAKIGSDVTFLFLRVLPRLKPGVLVHIHDIFYPESYPMEWVLEGRAWNESLFLRALLLGNSSYQIMAFNSYAAQAFPEVFRNIPEFLNTFGGSIWLRKVR